MRTGHYQLQSPACVHHVLEQCLRRACARRVIALLLALWSFAVVAQNAPTAAASRPVVAEPVAGEGRSGGAATPVLAPERAFVLDHEQTAQRLLLRWHIAPGHYLVKRNLRFRSESGVELEPLSWPTALQQADPTFGRVSVYRDELSLIVDLATLSGAREPLEIISQGCADSGICYPPLTTRLRPDSTLAAEAMPFAGTADSPPAAFDSAPSAGANAALQAFMQGPGQVSGGPDSERPDPGQSTSAPWVREDASSAPLLPPIPEAGSAAGISAPATDSGQFLPVEQAFQVSAVALDDSVLVRFEARPGYYLYRDRFEIRPQPAAQVRYGEAEIPPGEEKLDPYYGTVQVHYGQTDVVLPIVRGEQAPDRIELQYAYQGCADAGLCYPPMQSALVVDIDAVPPTRGLSLDDGAPLSPGIREVAEPPVEPGANGRDDVRAVEFMVGELSDTDKLARTVARGSALAVAATFFGFGLLLAFTPCVLPMVPILSSLIVGQHDAQGRQRPSSARGFALTATFVLGMSAAYTVAGVIAGLSGRNLQAFLQQPLVLVAFALLFVALALSMFGLFELQVPGFVQSRLSRVANRQRAGTWIGAAMMGVLSALIVGPCVAPPLAAALLVIGGEGDPLQGALALFALSMGMGTPLLLLGALGSRALPRAGVWMQQVKCLFGFVLLGAAVYVLERIISARVSLLLWAMLSAAVAVWLLRYWPVAASRWPASRFLRRTAGGCALAYAGVLVAGAFAGSESPLEPLDGWRRADAVMQFKRVKGLAEVERELRAASSAGRIVMLDYYADWCVSCKEM
ncbi:MAG: protein-disulfide reductase DsbD, partial [Gammaproteobacteria bacterium]|nr:protein-disulfide reductase DsbD [Gammaproteobacteria bacterium]